MVSLADADLALIGEAENDNSGKAISGAGDVDGDGLDDVLIGAPYGDYPSMVGHVHLVLAASLGTSSIVSLADADYRFEGEYSDSQTGWSVGAGDFNGDGFGDVLMGAYGNDDGGTDAGKSSVYAPNECNTAPRGLAVSIDPADPWKVWMICFA